MKPWLQASQFCLYDGTFKTAPNLFAQVYLLPSLFVLLPNKTQETYTRMWEIQLLCPSAQPSQMIMDYEKAVINSFLHFWPSTMVKCCFFHLTQNIWRKIQAEGLQAYNQDEELVLRISTVTRTRL